MSTSRDHAEKILGSNAEYLLTKRQVCPKCKGEQYVCHPAWQEYWKDPANQEQPTMPEEIPCPECDGVGYIESQIDLREALKELEV